MKDDAQSKFFKSRHMTFVIKQKVEAEITLLENLGVMKKVKYSNGAAPIALFQNSLVQSTSVMISRLLSTHG